MNTSYRFLSKYIFKLYLDIDARQKYKRLITSPIY